jgi:hypothetical protein
MAFSPRRVAGAHAVYLVATGAWSVVHRGSFERVTGRKRDFWLVRLVGGLALATGLSLGVAVARDSRRGQTVVLALASGAAFAAADVHAARAYSRVYALDAVLQALFSCGWLRTWKARVTNP